MFRLLRTKRIRIKQRKYFLFTHVAASNCTAAGDSYTSTYLSEVRFTFEWLKGYTYRCKEIKDIGKNKTFRILAAEVSVGEGSSGAMVLGKLSGPLRLYFSLYRAVSQRGGERRKKREMIGDRKNVQRTPPARTASTVGPCPTIA